MGTEAVDAIGGGRVWTGQQALENGLVDELGGLDQALNQAKELAGLQPEAGVRVFYPEKEPLPPIAEPAAAIKFTVDNFKLLSERSMCLLPWVELV
jgi:protease-4